MKTQKEILEKIKEYQEDKQDFMQIKVGDLIYSLDFEYAKPFLKEGTKEKDWAKDNSTKEEIVKRITDYMDFAWGKANDCRGLSAGRSIEHMKAWLWLLGDKKLQEKFDDTKYEHYGKEKLIVICEHLDIDWKKFDDGERTNNG